MPDEATEPSLDERLAAADAKLKEMLNEPAAVKTPQAPQALAPRTSTPEAQKAEAEPGEVPESERVPESPSEYQLHRAGIEIDSARTGEIPALQQLAHAAGVPAGVFLEISRDSERIAEQNLSPELQAELCDAELRRHFGKDFDRAEAGAQPILDALMRQYPGAIQQLEHAGLLYSVPLLKWLYGEGLKGAPSSRL